MLDIICPTYVLALVRTSYKGVDIRHTLREEELEEYFSAIDVILTYAHESLHRAIDYVELKDNGYIVVIYKHVPCAVYKISNFRCAAEELPCDL